MCGHILMFTCGWAYMDENIWLPIYVWWYMSLTEGSYTVDHAIIYGWSYMILNHIWLLICCRSYMNNHIWFSVSSYTNTCTIQYMMIIYDLVRLSYTGPHMIIYDRIWLSVYEHLFVYDDHIWTFPYMSSYMNRPTHEMLCCSLAVNRYDNISISSKMHHAFTSRTHHDSRKYCTGSESIVRKNGTVSKSV